MKLAIVSDIHGNVVALEAVMRHIMRHDPDVCINLGDCVTGPLWPRETLELLDTLRLPTVRGNHDRWIGNVPADETNASVLFTRDCLTDTQCASLAALPASLELEDFGILAVHGTPSHDAVYLLHEEVDGALRHASAALVNERLGDTSATLVLCGHSHTQYMAMARGGVLVLNPGSVGCPRYADNPDRSRAEAGSPHARYAIATRQGSSRDRAWDVEMFAVSYDWSVVPKQARRNGRPDFADGFLRQ